MARSPFQYVVPVALPYQQGNALLDVVQSFYDIPPKLSLVTKAPHCSPDLANWREYRASSVTGGSSTIRFVPKSTLTAARRFIAENPRYTIQHPNSLPTSSVGVLSFASAKRPGGGFLHGGDEQEEILARSTSLLASLQSSQVKEYLSDPQEVFERRWCRSA